MAKAGQCVCGVGAARSGVAAPAAAHGSKCGTQDDRDHVVDRPGIAGRLSGRFGPKRGSGRRSGREFRAFQVSRLNFSRFFSCWEMFRS